MNGQPIIGIGAPYFEWETIEEAFTRCKSEYGIEMVEFSADGNILTSRPDEVRGLALDHGVSLSLHIWENIAKLSVPDGVRMCRYWLQYCVMLGARHCVMHVGHHENAREGLTTVSHVVETVAPELEDADVMLVLENHYPYGFNGLFELGGSPEEFEFLFEINSPAVRFCFDVGHANLGCGPKGFIEALGSMLGVVHVSDNFGDSDTHNPYLQGSIDWKATLSGLSDLGFAGPYIIEFSEKLGIEHQKRFISDVRSLYGSAE